MKPVTTPAASLEAVLDNIRNPNRWAEAKTVFRVIRENPSLRGIVYGYVSELQFERHYLQAHDIVERFSKDDDHRKTKADRTVVYRGKPITIQIKSVQTNSIRFESGRFLAKVQNDASDRRRVVLPDGSAVETTCYLVGEYDLLAVSLHPFTGRWRFAFKENSRLQRTRSMKYSAAQRRYLLATLEPITFPLGQGWTEDFRGMLERIWRHKR